MCAGGRPRQDFSTQLELGDPSRAPLNPRHGASDEEFLINLVGFPSSEAPSLVSACTQCSPIQAKRTVSKNVRIFLSEMIKTREVQRLFS